METKTWQLIKEKYGVNKIQFGAKIAFVKDPYRRKIIFRDVEHAYELACTGFSKPALILAGGVIEELLRLYLDSNDKTPSGNTFESYIRDCQKFGYIKKAVSNLSDAIRGFRNLVHLKEEKSAKHAISKATAKGAIGSIFSIINDLD